MDQLKYIASKKEDQAWVNKAAILIEAFGDNCSTCAGRLQILKDIKDKGVTIIFKVMS